LRETLRDFRGPVLVGFPSGHTPNAAMTLPFGVRARVITDGRPALVIEEAAVIHR
jgi:muramoyltetrapeptide carboxypeptidase LdcA involved in peptidoglycan recycling